MRLQGRVIQRVNSVLRTPDGLLSSVCWTCPYVESPMIQTSRGRKVLSLLGLRIEPAFSEPLKEKPPHFSAIRNGVVRPPLQPLKVAGPPSLAQTKQDVPLTLGIRVTPHHFESPGGGTGSCSHKESSCPEQEGQGCQAGGTLVCLLFCFPNGNTLLKLVCVLHN